MADQHNANIPALTNQVASDIPDIKENLEFHKDALQLLFETWSDTDNSSNVLDSALGFSDGTYTYDFPTNGVAGNAVIMCGNSSTIVWMYLNAAPPGWKVTATGKDTVLAIYADSGDYAVAGGSADTSATWTIDGISAGNVGAEAAHTHTGPNHNHRWYDYTSTSNFASYDLQGNDESINDVTAAGGAGIAIVGSGSDVIGEDLYVALGGTGNTGAGSSHVHSGSTITEDGTWRPKASVGKLFQLDTA
jgi:hypothetical protein